MDFNVHVYELYIQLYIQAMMNTQHNGIFLIIQTILRFFFTNKGKESSSFKPKPVSIEWEQMELTSLDMHKNTGLE